MAEPFIFSNGQIAYNAEDLIKLCQQFPDDSFGYLMREDFEKWLSYIGANKIARYASEARQNPVSDEQKLDLFIQKSQTKPELKAVPTKPKVNLLTAIANFFKRNNQANG